MAVYLGTLYNITFREYQQILRTNARLGLYRSFGAVIHNIHETDSLIIHTDCQGTPQ
jgi:hypothetical protein